MKIWFPRFLAALLFGLAGTAGATNHMELVLSTDSVVMSEWLDVWVSLSWEGPAVSADVYLFTFDDHGDFGFFYPGCSRTQPWPTQFMGNVFVPSGATVEHYHIGDFPAERFALREPFGRHHIGIAMTERGTLNIIGGPVFEAFDILPSPLIWHGPNTYVRFEYDEIEGVWALVEARMGVFIHVDVLYSGHYTMHREPSISGHWIMGPDWRQSIELSMIGPWYELILNHLWWFTMTVDVQPGGADLHVVMEHRNRWERGSGEADGRAYPTHVEKIAPE